MTKLDMIAEPGTYEIVVTRVYDAPRDLLFKVFTMPEHIPHWWGPRYLTTIVDKMDVKPGGQWRFVQHDAEGHEFAFHGVYHDILSPERMVQTFEWEGLPGHVMLETATFEALPDGKTRFTNSSVFQSVADRDGMLSSGMESGAQDSYDRLAELVATL